MLKIVILSLLLSVQAYAYDFGKCNTLFPKNTPPKSMGVLGSEVRELCFKDFAVLYSPRTKTPLFSVEKLNYLRLKGHAKRTNHFHEEVRLRLSERSTLSDYNRSGYDRGHIAPAADFIDPVSVEESFSLANMSPQAPRLNRGIWAKNVEKPTREYVKRASGNVYVFTGPVFQGNKPSHTIGQNRVWVPDYFFKLVYDEGSQRSWVFYLPNSDNAQMSRPISYSEFVNKTGYELLGR